ncbi:MAG TPA: thioesterase family protein [Kiritimatiellia bacterium]|nr:thioesterase family protein [Kiritimatiellia bacterium]
MKDFFLMFTLPRFATVPSMSRIAIELPSTWIYTLDLPVRITDINYGQHLGNDAFLSMLQEARVRWLHQYQWTELDILGRGLIMVDLAVRFKTEAHFGHTLRFHLQPADWTEIRFELYALATHADTGKEIARARTGMIFFDYTTRKMAKIPPGFRERIGCPE